MKSHQKTSEVTGRRYLLLPQGLGREMQTESGLTGLGHPARLQQGQVLVN